MAILKILKTKSTTLSEDLFLCQVSKGFTGGHFENFKNKEHNGRHFEFVQPLKGCHTLRCIFLQSFMKFDEKESKKVFYHPFFVSMATAAKFVQPIPIFSAYLVPLDVDVIPIKFHQFLFGK